MSAKYTTLNPSHNVFNKQLIKGNRPDINADKLDHVWGPYPIVVGAEYKEKSITCILTHLL